MRAREAVPRTAMLALLAVVLPAAAARAPAQEGGQRAVEFTPRPDRPVERRLERFVDAATYRLWARDTTVARGDTVRGDVLVLESMVRIEGRVEGTLVAVDGDVFMRPHGTVTGDLLVLGGGMYRSSLASVEGEIVYEPNLLLQAVPRQGGYVIYPAAARPDPVDLDGLSGIRFPTVQRVDGWTLAAGGRFQAVDLGWQPSLHVTGGFRTAGDRWAGSASQYWYPSGRWRLGFEGGRGTRSMERWIRSDVANTLTFLFGGDDYRNYFESDRVLFTARHDFGGGESLEWISGWERVRSLPALEAGGLFGDDSVEPNPAVDAGDVWRAGLTGRIRRSTVADSLAVDLRLEAADASVAGDFSYLFGEARLDWRLPAAWSHRVEVEAVARGDLAGDLPRHRWSAAGGAGTLPAVDLLRLRGPRMLLGRATYLVPVPGLEVPRLGGPRLLVRAAAGSVWGEREDPTWHENLALGVRFLLFEGGVAWDPGGGPGDGVRGFFTVRLPR